MLYAALCLALAIVAWAGKDSDRMEERTPAQGLLWQVESGTATVYLLGVIHVGNDRFYPLSPAIESAFARADVLVQEMKSDPNSQLLLHKMVFEVGVYPPGARHHMAGPRRIRRAGLPGMNSDHRFCAATAGCIASMQLPDDPPGGRIR